MDYLKEINKQLDKIKLDIDDPDGLCLASDIIFATDDYSDIFDLNEHMLEIINSGKAVYFYSDGECAVVEQSKALNNLKNMPGNVEYFVFWDILTS